MTACTMQSLLDTLKRVAAALSEAEVPFIVAGGIAAWARGGPPTEHDVDLLIRERDVARASDACEAIGMRVTHPPEPWLVKAWDGDILVDLIFRPVGLVVDDGLFVRSDELDVAAMEMSVISIDDLFTAKLAALTEHNLNYSPLLEYARSLREQIDWSLLRRRTDGSAYASAFFTLVEELGIVDDLPAPVRGKTPPAARTES
jgi:hypothetical protein